jgi:alpha-amylase
MVQTCKDAGVDIIADAVINHMTGQETPGEGTAGSTYEHYEYPGIYTREDFHDCGSLNNDITVYTDRFEVQNCELVNLADLKTESEKVRNTLADYLNHLTELGVAGFRIDAAKHMPAKDIAAVIEKLDGEPTIIQEVIRGAGEPIQPEDYLDSGGVFEFSWGKDMKTLQKGSTFKSFFKAGTRSTYAPSESAYSGYAFTDHDTGAVMDPLEGTIFPAQCTERTGVDQQYTNGDYTCQQDWPTIRNMVAWRAYAGAAPVVEEWSENDGLAFAREGKSFIAVNRGIDPISGTWQTTLPAGEYCDGGAGTAWNDVCENPTHTVAEDGTVSGEIPSYGVLALTVGQQH